MSLTGDPAEEIRTAKLILKTLGLRRGGIEVVSCPTCGRTKIDLISLADKVEQMVADIPLDIKVAVMGCVVNGPGEAKEADIGIAGGCGEGLLIRHGEILKKLPEEELLAALREELLHWTERYDGLRLMTGEQCGCGKQSVRLELKILKSSVWMIFIILIKPDLSGNFFITGER